MTAVQVAYVGTKYSGLQKNPGQETIELELEKAFHAAGLIADCNFGDQHKVHWSRAARTDKGVHALGNVVSLKLMCPPDVDMVSETNKHLPKDILVLDMKRVTKGFNAKNQAEGRRYQYLIPSYAFMKAARPSAATCRKFVDDALPAWMREGHNKHTYTPTRTEIDTARKFTLSQELEGKIDQTLRSYHGTHKFHNFTSGKKATDASSSRYIV
jgi:tRNA pseudouridine38-40 synthase